MSARFELPTNNANTARIANDIRGKIDYLRSGGQLDTQLVAITDSPSLFGPFTLIEGNRRSIALMQQSTLVGTSMFVGYSASVVDCLWARHTYRTFIEARQAWQDRRA